MKVDLIFTDWKKDNKSIYHTIEGLELSLGCFHAGTTFSGTIELPIGENEELIRAIRDGFTPVFEVVLGD